jgi:hypothetical protein
MTIAKLLTQPDAIRDIGIFLTKLFLEFEKLGFKTFNLLKFLLYDVTIALNKLPFGNWISIIYFIVMSNIIKNIVEGGELNRLLSRAIHLYFIQRKSNAECISRFRSYLWRITMDQINELQSWTYEWVEFAWENTGETLKREVKRFAKEVVLENAEEIEKTVKEMAKTAAFSAMVSTLSQKLVSELGPVAVDAFSKSDIAKSIVDIQHNTGNIDRILENVYSVKQNTDTLQLHSSQVESAIDQMTVQMAITNGNVQSLSTNLAESIAMITDANVRGELHLLENNVLLNQKLSEISTQLEYLRVNQPSQFREILKTISLSTLALNDIGVPSTVVDTFAKLTGTLGYSSPRRRIENI